MRKVFLLVFILILGMSCEAFEVVYPKSQQATINSASTFFIGNSCYNLTINGQKVPRNSKGAFAYVVPLNIGENIFEIEGPIKKQIYKITRPTPKSYATTAHKQIDFSEYKTVITKQDNVALRSTPIDAGINRLTHLPLGVSLTVSGEKNGFYKVILDAQQNAWIAKDDVINTNENSQAKIINIEYLDTDEFYTCIIHLNKKVPFIMSEGSTMTLKLYNVEGESPYTINFPYTQNFDCKKLYGYSGEYLGNDFIWKVRKPPQIDSKQPLKGITIAVDAGHGGKECGAISCFGDKEKDINLEIARHLQQELKKLGAKVYMTRTHDTYVGLKDRVDKANENNAVILVSIHGNALPDNLDPNKNSGTSIFYYYEQARPLAECILNEMTSQLNLNNDKVRQASLALVRNTNALSILIEVGYLINPDDSSIIRESDFQKATAKAISDGLEKFFKN